MSGVGRLVVFLLSFPFPGLGYALTSRRRAAIGMPLASMATFWLFAFHPWVLMPLVIGLLINAITASIAINEHKPPAVPASTPPIAVVAGHDPEMPPPRWNSRLAAVSVLISIAAMGVTRLALKTFTIKSVAMAPTLVDGDSIFIETLTVHVRPPAPGDVVAFTSPCSERRLVMRVAATEGQHIELRCGALYVDGRPTDVVSVPGQCSYSARDRGALRTHRCRRSRETLGAHTYEIFHDDLAQTPSPTFEFPLEQGPSCLDDDITDTGTIVETQADARACTQHRYYVVPPGHVFVLGDNRDAAFDSRYFGSVPVDHVAGRVTSRFGSGDGNPVD